MAGSRKARPARSPRVPPASRRARSSRPCSATTRTCSEAPHDAAEERHRGAPAPPAGARRHGRRDRRRRRSRRWAGTRPSGRRLGGADDRPRRADPDARPRLRPHPLLLRPLARRARPHRAVLRLRVHPAEPLVEARPGHRPGDPRGERHGGGARRGAVGVHERDRPPRLAVVHRRIAGRARRVPGARGPARRALLRDHGPQRPRRRRAGDRGEPQVRRPGRRGAPDGGAGPRASWRR